MPLIDIHVLGGGFDDTEKARIMRETARACGLVAGPRIWDTPPARMREVKSASRGGADPARASARALTLKSGA
ncbi:4-oxalocrotonate tautomerase [Pseudooceanicola sp. 216_PA32_1]|uniref:4-oxalocrotonate tautomerase n=1 Tax=Pseudooceanicola pacificus TaxID=2676438 RepID=A0A844WGA4_9RHOB|nr:4-oxalocrotonate tautomerase [Pseudooceanicola pacificus]MWB78909.1 4-oxalocrotonate tautomerase [Pseudooceanicola pacificus]